MMGAVIIPAMIPMELRMMVNSSFLPFTHQKLATPRAAATIWARTKQSNTLHAAVRLSGSKLEENAIFQNVIGRNTDAERQTHERMLPI